MNPLRASTLSLAVLISAVLCSAMGNEAAAAELVVTVESFDVPLAPYGEWVVVGGFGRVWRPSHSAVGVDFVPYASAGHWVLTDEGWAFDSDYTWGWAPFHYGRWFFTPEYGWVWAPDTFWGPAWVQWRLGGSYSGWAPLPPDRIYATYHSYSTPWVFVETRYVTEVHVQRYALPAASMSTAFAATAVLSAVPAPSGRASWHPGPSAADVERQVGHAIPRAVLPAPPPLAVRHDATPAGVATVRTLPPDAPRRSEAPRAVEMRPAPAESVRREREPAPSAPARLTPAPAEPPRRDREPAPARLPPSPNERSQQREAPAGVGGAPLQAPPGQAPGQPQPTPQPTKRPRPPGPSRR